MKFDLSYELRQSANTLNDLCDIAPVITFIAEVKSSKNVRVERCSFDELKQWRFSTNGQLSHITKRFFEIIGVRVKASINGTTEWDQPIISQPEVGILGLLTAHKDGILHFLVQAKIEPGNSNVVQLSPTLQATKSNYLRVHGGGAPTYLSKFVDAPFDHIIYDQLQSEQGARFFKKRNRNIIIYTEHEVGLSKDFIWLTLGQILTLIRIDNLVNMDLRTVLSGVVGTIFQGDYFRDIELLISNNYTLGGQAANYMCGRRRLVNVFHKMSSIRSRHDVLVSQVPLHKLRDWHVSRDSIERTDKKFFRVLAFKVNVDSREVVSWDQPLVEPRQAGLCALICSGSKSSLRILCQLKFECGNRDIIELSPTIQCLTGDYREADSVPPPFLNHILNATTDEIIFDSELSEEGGRFFNEKNRYCIVYKPTIDDEIPDEFAWLTVSEVSDLISIGNYVNIQARSLFVCLISVLVSSTNSPVGKLS